MSLRTVNKKWYPVPTYLPADLETVWCRTWNSLAPPFAAVWHNDIQCFVTTKAIQHIFPDQPPPPDPPAFDTVSIQIVYPCYCIYKWKPGEL